MANAEKIILGLVICLVAFGLSGFLFVELTGYTTEPKYFSLINYYMTLGDTGIYDDQALITIGFGIAAAIGGIYFLMFDHQNKRSARFATYSEIEKMDMFKEKPTSIILGKYRNRFIFANGDTHVLVVAPTGGGKNVGVVYPTLLSYDHSIVITDSKEANYQQTAGFRKANGQDVYKFAPFDPDGKTHCFNILAEISENDDLAVDDAQFLSSILIKDNPKDPFWSNNPRNLLTALILWLRESQPTRCSMGEIFKLINNENFISILESEKSNIQDPLARNTIGTFLQMPEKTRQSVGDTVKSGIIVWSSPLVDRATSKSDFSLADLKRKKMTVYFVVPVSDVGRFSPFIRLFYEFMLKRLTQRLPTSEEPYELLLIPDEFARYKKIESIADGLAYLREYKIRIMPILQSEDLAIEHYGDRVFEDMMQNISFRVGLKPNDRKSAGKIADTIGMSIRQEKSKQRSRGGVSVSSRDKYDHLINQEELLNLKETQSIIYAQGKVFMGKRITHYKDRVFKNRIIDPPESPIQKKRAIIDMADMFKEKINSQTVDNPDDPGLNPDEIESILNEAKVS